MFFINVNVFIFSSYIIIADAEMYAEKEKHYKRKGIDRRRAAYADGSVHEKLEITEETKE